MPKYAPSVKDLASRDVVSRAMATEIKDGRGCGPQADHLLLKLDHLGVDVIEKRLPGIREISKKFANGIGSGTANGMCRADLPGVRLTPGGSRWHGSCNR